LGRGTKAVLLLAAFVILFAGMRAAADVLVPFMLAAFLATVTAPLVLWMCEHGVPRGVAVATALLVDIGALAAIGAVLGESLNALYAQIPVYQEQITGAIEQGSGVLRRMGIPPESIEKQISSASMMGVVTMALKSVAGMVSNLVIVLIIVAFMLFEATGIRTKLRNVFGADPERLHKASDDITKYLVMKTATSALTGVAVGVWLFLWGVDLAVLWGLIAFLLSYIPTLGGILAGVPILLFSWLQLGTGPTIGVAAGYVVVNMFIGNFLEPRIFGRALGISPLVVFLSMIFWGWLLGPVGALLSVPLTMIAKIALWNTEDLRWIAVLLATSPAERRPSWIPAALQKAPDSIDTALEAPALKSPEAEE
jgi:predicted PurR-regulated permease PerM